MNTIKSAMKSEERMTSARMEMEDLMMGIDRCITDLSHQLDDLVEHGAEAFMAGNDEMVNKLMDLVVYVNTNIGRLKSYKADVMTQMVSLKTAFIMANTMGTMATVARNTDSIIEVRGLERARRSILKSAGKAAVSRKQLETIMSQVGRTTVDSTYSEEQRAQAKQLFRGRAAEKMPEIEMAETMESVQAVSENG